MILKVVMKRIHFIIVAAFRREQGVSACSCEYFIKGQFCIGFTGESKAGETRINR